MGKQIIVGITIVTVVLAWIFFIIWLIRNVREENKKQEEMAKEGRQYWVELADQFYKEQEEDKQ